MTKSSWNAVEINQHTTGAKWSCWITSVKKEKQAFHVELLQSRAWHHSPRHYAQPASHNILSFLGFYLSIHWKSTVNELLHLMLFKKFLHGICFNIYSSWGSTSLIQMCQMMQANSYTNLHKFWWEWGSEHSHINNINQCLTYEAENCRAFCMQTLPASERNSWNENETTNE